MQASLAARAVDGFGFRLTGAPAVTPDPDRCPHGLDVREPMRATTMWRSRRPEAYGALKTSERSMKTTTRGMGLVLATSVLLLAGCVSPGGYAGSPDGYGQPAGGYPSQQYPTGQYPPQQYPSRYGSQLQGTVDGVDPGSNRIVVVVEDPRSGRAERMDVRYDQSTRLVYQGRESAVTGLERGDVIRFDATQSGRELYARSIEVVRNVREGGYGGGYNDAGNSAGNGYGNDYGNDYGNGNDLRGTVGFVDTRSRLIRLDAAGGGNGVQLEYDDRTTVEYQGNRYRPENLERGDQVRIQARQMGNNRWLAERIIVERSISR